MKTTKNHEKAIAKAKAEYVANAIEEGGSANRAKKVWDFKMSINPNFWK